MFCSKCGKEIQSESSFCSFCGAPIDKTDFPYESGESIETPQQNAQKSKNTQKTNVKNEVDESVKKSKVTLLVMILVAVALVIVELLTLTIGGMGPKGNPVFKLFFFTYFIGGIALLVIGGIMSVRAFSINNTALCTMNEAYENGVDLGIMTNEELEQCVRSMELSTVRFIGRGADGSVLIEGTRKKHIFYVEDGLVKINLPYFQYRISTIWRTLNEWRIPSQIRESIEANHIMDEIALRMKPEVVPDASRYEKCKPRGDKMITSLGIALCGLLMFLLVLLYAVTYTGNKVPSETMKDAYDVAGMTEEEFLGKTGFSRNEFGSYPNEDDSIFDSVFTFEDGKLMSISMFEGKGEEYSFNGMSIGDAFPDSISGFSKIEYPGSEGVNVRGYRDDTYPNYMLTIKCNEDGTIHSITYSFIEDELWQEMMGDLDEFNKQNAQEEIGEAASIDIEDVQTQETSTVENDIPIREGMYDLDSPITDGIGKAYISYAEEGLWLSIYYDNFYDVGVEYCFRIGMTDRGDGTYYYGAIEDTDVEIGLEKNEDGIYIGGSARDWYNWLYPMLGTYTYTEPMFEVTVNAPDGYVNMREGEDTAFDVFTTINNGVVLPVYAVDSSGSWLMIEYQDAIGWVAKSQVAQ